MSQSAPWMLSVGIAASLLTLALDGASSVAHGEDAHPEAPPAGWPYGWRWDPEEERFVETRISQAAGRDTADEDTPQGDPGYRCFGSYHPRGSIGELTGYADESVSFGPAPTGTPVAISNHQCVVCAPERVDVGKPFKVTWATGGDTDTFRWGTGSIGNPLAPNLTPLPASFRLLDKKGELTLTANKAGSSIVELVSKPRRNDLADVCVVPIVTNQKPAEKMSNLGYYCAITGPATVRVGETFTVQFRSGPNSTGSGIRVASARGWEGPVDVDYGNRSVKSKDPLLNISSWAGGGTYGLRGNTFEVKMTEAGTASLQLEVYGLKAENGQYQREPEAICDYQVVASGSSGRAPDRGIDPKNPSGIKPGDRIRITAPNGRQVRSSAAGPKVGRQSFGSQGTVISGPERKAISGVLLDWFNVDFDTGSDGWVGSFQVGGIGRIDAGFIEKISGFGDDVSDIGIR